MTAVLLDRALYWSEEVEDLRWISESYLREIDKSIKIRYPLVAAFFLRKSAKRMNLSAVRN